MLQAVEGYHWGNIADYAHILSVSPNIVGAALPRETVRAAFADGAAAVFGAEAATYGLMSPLPDNVQAQREDLQFSAHCEAMPRDMMGGLVEAQRLRDASFARAILDAIETHGRPVVFITGNGHARTDWGVPAYLQEVRPDLAVTSVGQGENDVRPQGSYSWTIQDAPSPARKDPCAAFQ
jgi:uncharacterized iron-regulated protein